MLTHGPNYVGSRFKWMQTHDANYVAPFCLILMLTSDVVQLLVDGPGILKYSGFGLSRVEGENLAELFEQFADSREHWGSEVSDNEGDSDIPVKLKTMGKALILLN